MGLLRYLGVHSPLQMKFFNMLVGREKVGEDSLGNRYYRAAPRKGYKKERRWVMYLGDEDASMVPPQWHAWLHHQSDDIPDEEEKIFQKLWQKPHQPNFTGTDKAYHPQRHALKGGKRPKATGDYEPWQPPE